MDIPQLQRSNRYVSYYSTYAHAFQGRDAVVAADLARYAVQLRAAGYYCCHSPGRALSLGMICVQETVMVFLT